MAAPARFSKPRPPEKGVFPLDHFGECNQEKARYMDCLSKSNNDTDQCKEQAKKYLSCRMSKELMAPQSLIELGFIEEVKAGVSGPGSGRKDEGSGAAGAGPVGGGGGAPAAGANPSIATSRKAS